jgi:adenosylmethionine-8-amino-7-oxononanoate aminotransferase
LPAIRQPAVILRFTCIHTQIQHSWHRLGPHIIAQGDGVFVHDESGNRFYEGMSGLWCTSLGFSEPELVNAAIAQFNKLPFYHSFAGKTVDPAIELAEMLIAHAPPAGWQRPDEQGVFSLLPGLRRMIQQ